jgi:uncharacterized protein YcbK (DUF882 family)
MARLEVNGALALAFAAVLVSTAAWAEAPKPHTGAKPAAPRYGTYVKNWHTPAAGKVPSIDAAGRPMLAIFSINTNDRVELSAAGDNGGFSARDLDRAAFVLREPSSGNEHPVEPRILDVLYRIQTHFAAQEVRVISAYRTPHGGSSNHGQGRAIDLVVPGASDDAVARYAREVGFVGVGIYPTSGFVHVDARARSYFWVDSSAPGRKNRERGIMGDLAKKSDEKALSRGERSTPPYAIATDVDAVLRARTAQAAAQAAAPAPPVQEEDEDTETP